MSQQIVTIKTTVDQAAYLKQLVVDDQKRMEGVLIGMDPAHIPDELQTNYLHNEAIRLIL
jgi:hypothetical protein